MADGQSQHAGVLIMLRYDWISNFIELLVYRQKSLSHRVVLCLDSNFISNYYRQFKYTIAAFSASLTVFSEILCRSTSSTTQLRLELGLSHAAGLVLVTSQMFRGI